jgi:hypothetical protein
MPPARFLADLNANGWRWSKRHRCWHADVSEENQKFADAICAGQVPPLAHPVQSKSSDGGMAQANEEAYFDNFCRNNGL